MVSFAMFFSNFSTVTLMNFLLLSARSGGHSFSFPTRQKTATARVDGVF
jgi:hypothetical protein